VRWGVGMKGSKAFPFHILRNKIPNKSGINFGLTSLSLPAVHVPFGRMQH